MHHTRWCRVHLESSVVLGMPGCPSFVYFYLLNLFDCVKWGLHMVQQDSRCGLTNVKYALCVQLWWVFLLAVFEVSRTGVINRLQFRTDDSEGQRLNRLLPNQ